MDKSALNLGKARFFASASTQNIDHGPGLSKLLLKQSLLSPASSFVYPTLLKLLVSKTTT